MVGFGRSWWLLAGMLVFAACKEDFSQSTSEWNQLVSLMSTRQVEMKHQYSERAAQARALPPVPEGNANAREVRSRLEESLKAEAASIGELDQLVHDSRSGFESALQTGKISEIQSFTSSTRGKFGTVSTALRTVSENSKSLLAKARELAFSASAN